MRRCAAGRATDRSRSTSLRSPDGHLRSDAKNSSKHCARSLEHRNKAGHAQKHLGTRRPLQTRRNLRRQHPDLQRNRSILPRSCLEQPTLRPIARRASCQVFKCTQRQISPSKKLEVGSQRRGSLPRSRRRGVSWLQCWLRRWLRAVPAELAFWIFLVLLSWCRSDLGILHTAADAIAARIPDCLSASIIKGWFASSKKTASSRLSTFAYAL